MDWLYKIKIIPHKMASIPGARGTISLKVSDYLSLRNHNLHYGAKDEPDERPTSRSARSSLFLPLLRRRLTEKASTLYKSNDTLARYRWSMLSFNVVTLKL